MSKVTCIALLIAWILSNINCLIWRRRAIDAEKMLKLQRTANELLIDIMQGAERKNYE